MESCRYFSELRQGRLSRRRLQGWAIQRYIHNIALLKGFALCMVKNGHEPDLFKSRKTNLLPLPVSAEREARAQYSRFPPPVL